jgi:hypothetical protein
MHERLVQAEGHFNPKGLNPDEPRGFFCVFKPLESLYLQPVRAQSFVVPACFPNARHGQG